MSKKTTSKKTTIYNKSGMIFKTPEGEIKGGKFMEVTSKLADKLLKGYPKQIIESGEAIVKNSKNLKDKNSELKSEVEKLKKE